LIPVAHDADNRLNDNDSPKSLTTLAPFVNHPSPMIISVVSSPNLINDLLDADLATLLFSPDVNIFLISSLALKAMLHRHHVSGIDALSVTQARHALLSHLISGSRIGVGDAINHSMHACRCAQFRSAYGSEHVMAFDALSILLSASPERSPYIHMVSVIQCLALPSASSDSREAFSTEIGSRRSAIIEIHASANPACVQFENVFKLPKGSLVSLAQSHGLNICKPDSKTLLNFG
jgi:hypothetical protein